MTTVDFEALLSRKADDIRPPATFPVGTFKGVIKESVRGTSRQKGTPFIGFSVIPTDVIDADDQELTDFGDWQAYELRPSAIGPLTFYITDNSLWRLVAKDQNGEWSGFFHDVLGMDPTGKEIVELEAEAIGQELIFTVGHSAGDNGTIYANITEVARA